VRRGILATRDELRALRDRIAVKPFDRIYDALRKRCSLIIESAPVTESHWQRLWSMGHRLAAMGAAKTVQGRIIDLLIAHHIEPNDAYCSRAAEELKNLAGWTTWVDPCHSGLSADLCTAEAAMGAAVGLDWLWEDLSRADRMRVLQAIRRKAIEPYHQAVRDGAWWCTCYHSWNAVTNGGCAIAGLALGDEEPLAEEVFLHARTAMRNFFNALGREGGWDEGTSCWGAALRYVLLLGEAASRLVDDQRVFHERGMDVTGLFPIYFTPNGRSASFGDNSAVPVYGTLYNLVRHFGLKDLAWWLDTYTLAHDATTTGWSQAGLALLFRPVDVRTPRTLALAPVKVFNEIGWAAVADHWPKPSFYVAAKTGDLAAYHSRRDMNAIRLQVDGEMILNDAGRHVLGETYPSEAHRAFYEVQARAHNTVVVADADHRIDAQGLIAEAQAGKTYRWVVCDARDALGPNVRFIRHVVMLLDRATADGKVLLVLDEITNAVPETIEVFWHTGGTIERAGRSKAGRIVGGAAEVYFALPTTVRASVTTASYAFGSGQNDNVMTVSSGVMGTAYLAAIFSRDVPGGRATVKVNRGGSVTVAAGTIKARFRPGPNHLELEQAVC